jgi:CheY-like chemotaxis protein
MPPAEKAVPTIVMVVDDEPQVLDVERHILEGAGYQVLLATSALDAIARIAAGPPLDLLITDLDMPELGGDEMVSRIRGVRPDLKVLFVTGHADLDGDSSPVGGRGLSGEAVHRGEPPRSRLVAAVWPVKQLSEATPVKRPAVRPGYLFRTYFSGRHVDLEATRSTIQWVARTE